MYIKVLQKNKIKLNNSYFLLLDVYSKTRNKVCSILKSDAYKILTFSTILFIIMTIFCQEVMNLENKNI
jgi:hypothetical protein